MFLDERIAQKLKEQYTKLSNEGLLLAAHLTNNSTLRIQLHRVARSFQEDVSSIQLDHHVFKRLRRELNRLTEAYKPAITLIELLFAATRNSIGRSSFCYAASWLSL